MNTFLSNLKKLAFYQIKDPKAVLTIKIIFWFWLLVFLICLLYLNYKSHLLLEQLARIEGAI
jgi:hypothetical protein